MSKADGEPPQDGWQAVVDPNFLQDLEHWTRTDRRRALRTLRLVEAVLRDPFNGPGSRSDCAAS